MEWISVPEAGRRLGKSPHSIRRLIDMGILVEVRPPGTHGRIDAATLDVFLHGAQAPQMPTEIDQVNLGEIIKATLEHGSKLSEAKPVEPRQQSMKPRGRPFAPGQSGNPIGRPPVRLDRYQSRLVAGIVGVLSAEEKLERKRGKESIYSQSKKHNLTVERRNAMIAKQENRCSCCKAEFGPRPRAAPCVDHSHKTGKVRGVLCGRCNSALGHAKDNPKVLRALADYLESHRA